MLRLLGQNDLSYFMPVKRALLLAAFLVATPVNAEISDDVKATCMEAKDFIGCVQALSGSSPVESNNLEPLKKALKRLPSRLENTNLRDFTANTQFFSDAIVDITEDDLKTDYARFVFAEARAINDMLDALQSAWSDRISDGTYYGSYGYRSYYCRVLRGGVAEFNVAAGYGSLYTVEFSSTGKEGGLFSLSSEECSPHEYKMINAIKRRVADALVSPEEKQAQLDKEKREKELCEMAPWQRYLEENPGMKQWAEANPGPAAVKKKKFLANPKNQTTCQAKANNESFGAYELFMRMQSGGQ